MTWRSIAILGLLAAAACSGGGSGEDENARVLIAGEQCSGISAAEMIWVDGGSFTMGEDPLYREEGPPRDIAVDGFWIARTEVTNAQFAQFVAETGYITEAERDPPAFPGASPEMLQPGSAVFRVPTRDDPSWWAWSVGAQWRSPSGGDSAIDGRDNDPVVQVSYKDALAYAEWAGMSLPSEAQWEFAARGGGDVLPEPIDDDGNPQANYYQGVFPARDTGTDGFLSRAPAGCFEANGYGLHDMIGNVWEWTSDDGSRVGAMAPVQIIKGGSFLCAANYCARYRPAARQYQERDLATDHIGFRVVDNDRPAPPS